MAEFSINLKSPQDSGRTPSTDVSQEMFYHAIAFFQAGSRCDVNIRLSPNITSSLSAPAAVCYALSIEIYFKLLCKLSGVRFPRQHSFVDLFSGLSDADKKLILERANMTEEAFTEQIKPLSDTFVRWRYLYEQDSAWTSITTLAWLAQLLHNTIRASRPHLKVTYENSLALPDNFKY